MSNAVCRGCWVLGNNCGECSRCLATAKDGVKELRRLINENSKLTEDNASLAASLHRHVIEEAERRKCLEIAESEATRLRRKMLRMFDRCENWSAADMRAAIADALRTTVQELEDRDE